MKENENTEEQERKPKALGDVARSFKFGIQAVRVLSERIGAVADEHDKKAFDALMQALKPLMPDAATGESAEAVGENGGETIEAHVSAISPVVEGAETQESPAAVVTDVAGEAPPEDASRAFAASLKDPVVRDGFVKQLQAFMKASPVQGQLLRNSALTALFSTFELLVAELLHAYYSRYPAALPAAERTLTLEELREIGSLEEAERFIVSKEVDSVLRESLESQLQYFARRLKVTLEPVGDVEPRLIEIAQRRNLIVHNAGMVNKTYLKKVAPAVLPEEVVEGEALNVSGEYLNDSIDILFAVGAGLLQRCWRKWEPTDVEDADDWAIDSCYDALTDGRYELVMRLAELYSHTGISSDATRRVITVNKAIAVRESGGEAKEVESVVDGLDWSSCSGRYLLAKHVLKREDESFFDLVPRALAAREITHTELAEWPLFAPLRQLERWAEVCGAPGDDVANGDVISEVPTAEEGDLES